MADHVRIHEVGPRDGLQNEPGVISVARKVALIDLLSRSGLRDIEVGSFVSPKWVPQMANSDQVLAGLTPQAGVRYAVLGAQYARMGRVLGRKAPRYDDRDCGVYFRLGRVFAE